VATCRGSPAGGGPRPLVRRCMRTADHDEERWNASARSRSLLHGPMCGPVRFPMGTCRPSAPMRPAAVNTSITRHGGCDATYRSSAGSNGFAEALPGLRATCDASLRRRGLHREKSLALAIRLLDEGSFRLGSEAYARDNGTSPRDDPTRPRADRGLAHHVRLHGEEREAACSDDRRRRLSRIVRATGRHCGREGCRRAPGQHAGGLPCVVHRPPG